MKKIQPLGISRTDEGVALVGLRGVFRKKLVLVRGRDRVFLEDGEDLRLVSPMGRAQDPGRVSDVRLSRVMNTGILTYSVEAKEGLSLHIATRDSSDKSSEWEVLTPDRHLTGNGMVVPEYRHEGKYVLYSTDQHLRVAFSKDLSVWNDSGVPALEPRGGEFDEVGVKLVAVEHIEGQGILVLYESFHEVVGGWATTLAAAIFASDNPTRLIWRSDAPLWEDRASERDEKIPLGAVVKNGVISLYFTSRGEKLGIAQIKVPFLRTTRAARKTKLHRAPQNPVLSPTVYEWESEAVFNPGVFVDEGRVHLLYRAMGSDGVSRIGYASSPDGINFDERLEYPVYEPALGFGAPAPGKPKGQYDPKLNPSGGGWAGCEDPRAVVIDGKAYMSFVAFDGWNYIRQALTSIPLEDLRSKNWNWRKPVLISKPGETHKNWVIFPEKINGKYAVLHGLSPKIHLDYVDSLDELGDGNFIKSMPSHGGAGYTDAARQNHWDNRVRGAGSPPIKTDMGWLLLYHATDKRDPGKYKLGAMLLDLEDPTKVLYRSNAPILEPVEWYENDGKPGVVYTCGAVIVNENLIVYYGGGDKRIAVARANAQEFIKHLIADEIPSLQTVAVVEG